MNVRFWPIANLKGAKITLEQIRSATIDEKTNIPNGMNKEDLLAKQREANGWLDE